MNLWNLKSFKKKFIDLKKVTVIFVVQHFQNDVQQNI